MIATRHPRLCLLLAFLSFALSAPAPPKPHGRPADLRAASLIQIDDDEAREILPASTEADDEEGGDPPDDEEASG